MLNVARKCVIPLNIAQGRSRDDASVWEAANSASIHATFVADTILRAILVFIITRWRHDNRFFPLKSEKTSPSVAIIDVATERRSRNEEVDDSRCDKNGS